MIFRADGEATTLAARPLEAIVCVLGAVRPLPLFSLLFLLLALDARPPFAAEELDETVTHYVSDDGSIGFVLDSGDSTPILKFDTSLEIFVLESVPGPRGDTIYKLDNSFAVLRKTNIGGMILFDDVWPEGRPVVRDGPAEPLTLPQRFPAQVSARAAALGQAITEKVGSEIVFEADWDAVPSQLGTATLADAVELAGMALLRLADDALARDALATRLKRVTFTPGDTLDIDLRGDTLVVTYVWTRGVHGRHSSDAIVRYLETVL